MNCKNCGSQMEDDALFCPECGYSTESVNEGENAAEGAVVQEDYEPTERFVPQDIGELDTEAEVQPSFSLNTQGEEIAPKKKKRGFLIGGIIAAVVAVAALVIIFWPYVTGFFKNTFTAPDMLLKKSYEDSLGKVFNGEYDVIEDLKDLDLTNMSYSGQIKLTADPMATNLLASATGQDFSWFSNATVDYDFSVVDNMTEFSYSGKLNGSDIGSIEQVMNLQTNEQWISAPDYFPSVLHSKIYDDDSAGVVMYNSLKDMDKMISLIPSANTLETVLVRYSEILLSGFSDVEKSSETVKVDGISQNLTKLTAEMGEEELLDALLDIVDVMKDDEELKDIIYDYEDIIGRKGMYDQFLYSLEHIQKKVDNISAEDMPEIDLKLITYLNGKSEIVGIALEVEAGGHEFEPFYWVRVQNGNKFASELIVSSEAVRAISSLVYNPYMSRYMYQYLQGDFVIEGSGSMDNKKLNAEYDVYMDDTKVITLGISDYICDKNGISGSFKIAPSKEALQVLVPMLPIDPSAAGIISSATPYVNLRISGNLNDISLDADLYAMGDKKLLSVGITAKSKNPDTIEIPTQNVVQGLPVDQMMTAGEKLRKNLLDAGMPQEIIMLLLSNVM